MIHAESLNFAYKKKNPLFTDLNFRAEKGKIYGLLGKNGAGKTTLLKQIAGLLYPQNGKIQIDKQNVAKRSAKTLTDYYFLAEEFYVPNLTISNFVKINAPFYPLFDRDKFNRYIDEFQMPKSNKLNKMSYGQKKKLLIAFSLAAQTPVLFADEPTNGLDIPSKQIFRKMMTRELNEERLFIISTHQVKDIEGIIDAVVILNEGQIIFNQDLQRVSELVRFTTVQQPDDPEIIYAEKQFNGYRAMVKNTSGEPAHVNIELLFNALTGEQAKNIQSFFHKHA